MEIDATLWLLTALAGFAAGLIDSIVGGGGLVLTPAMLNLHPGLNILQAIGTQRTSSIMGTSVAAWNYLRKIHVERRIILPACAAAMAASAIGVQFAKRLDPDLLKWTVLAICVILALYTAFRKDLGLKEERRFHPKHESVAALSIGAATGFYNGLIGPGTGTIMVFAFVSFLGLDFLKSSAVSKAANVSADISSWTVLLLSGFVLWVLALPLVIGNMLGSYIGSHMAIRKGQAFVRAVFLVIVLALIARQAWQLAAP
ncbi:sulfite exporter TauE/SafE family protein [Arenimonas sp. GDDSR-1]|uniref:sulfite exporter TauE/SafE family protein n=1 Tax=Arenimonas sp. GDDSR-1 TaxID=2950125 RepID=UPI00263A000A|nr:sulfite exporter TauE/SafE family protein [Arenimonas sp. GDDSR-1]